MRRACYRTILWSVVLVALGSPACIIDGVGRPTGTFEKGLDVSGPVRLELRNSSGDVTILPGPPGTVRVRGEVRRQEMFWGGGAGAEDIVKNPPIEQAGSTIRIGQDTNRLRGIQITYTIEVPTEITVVVHVGSGNLALSGVKGPVEVSTGSGEITLRSIGDAAFVKTGSGDLEIRDVGGELRASAGSGDIAITNVGGDVQTSTGSGDIEVSGAGGRITARTGSGDVEVTDVPADLRVRTGSGSVSIRGRPARNTYWDVDTGSGDIHLDVPGDASFRLYARSRSIVTDIPLTIEERTRRELRARAGAGDARIEARTSSGTIRVQ